MRLPLPSPGVTAGATRKWAVYNNICVTATGDDAIQTNQPIGDVSRQTCQDICAANVWCSAFEWYNSGWDGSKCKLILGRQPSTQGSTSARWMDAECHVKPGSV